MQHRTPRNRRIAKLVIGVPDSPLEDSELLPGEAALYLDETEEVVVVRVRLSSGDYATGEIALTPDNGA